MKQIKKTVMCLAGFLCIGGIYGQNPEEKKDTMYIQLNGEKISISVPNEGNKTTISLEDSTSIIQISIGKVSKFKTYSNQNSIANKKLISYFNEVELGYSVLLNRNFNSNERILPEFVFSNSSNSYAFNNRANIGRVVSENRNSGFHFGFSIREKRRPFLNNNSKIMFITGSRFRYNRFSDIGEFENKNIKANLDSGEYTYFRDSVFSVRTDKYRSTNSSYLLVFPFMLEKQMVEKFFLSAGIQLGIGIHTNVFKTNSFNSTTKTTGLDLQLQPMLKIRYDRFSLYLATKLGKERIETETMHTAVGNLLFFGLAYKVY